jgi:hypothetical protein
MTVGPDDRIDRTESAAAIIDRMLMQIVRTLETDDHLNFFRAMVLMRRRLNILTPVRPTLLQRALRRLSSAGGMQPAPRVELPEHPVDHALEEIAETLHAKRGMGRTESLALVHQIVDETVRSTAHGIVKKCVEPATAAWVITNARLSPMLASPEFVQAGEAIATRAMPSETTLDFLGRLVEAMAEENEGDHDGRGTA